MAKPLSLLQGINAFARDFARDRMPRGYLWDLVDYVPALLDAMLVSRGAWRWASAVAPADFEGGIHALFKAGERLLAVDATGTLRNIDLTTGALTTVAVMHRVAQNPVQYMDYVIVPDAAGAASARVVNWNGSAYTNVAMHASALKGRYAAVYKGRILLANAVGLEGRIAFSPPGLIDPDPAPPDNSGKPDLIPWDSLSYFSTSLPLTGIGALRAVVLLFHEGSVERLRGAIPPSASDPLGDMFLEPLYERAGCGDARSIAYWNDNCIFADERGVHFTDGAIVKNLCTQGGILTYWRTLYRQRLTVAADTFLDYYIITVIRQDNVAVTLICDLNRRTWFRFTNIRARGFIHSVGAQEQLWGCRKDAARLTKLSDCFFPPRTALAIDEDGTNVLPVLETPWYRLAEEGRKRIRHSYLSYDVREDAALAQAWRGEPDEEGQVLEEIEQDAQALNGQVKATLGKILELGYITNPHDLVYTLAGGLPATNGYSRYRLPVRKNPYGIAFRVRQLAPSFVTRIYDLGVEAQAEERSRV
jgi:hypothetical protein